VLLQVRHVPENGHERFVERHENAWPLARTRWTPLHLDPRGMQLSPTPFGTQQSVNYDAMGDGLTFSTSPLTEDTEFTGPVALKLFASSSTADADLFVVLRVGARQGSCRLCHAANG